MGIITNTFTSGDAEGLRESLSEFIYNLKPSVFPVSSMASKGRAEATLVEWQTDADRAAVTTNAQLEGDQWSATARTPTKRLGNYTQIMRDVFVISGTEEVVAKAGRKSEVAYQVAKAGRELRRDLEENITKADIAGVGGQTRKFASLGAFIITNVDEPTDAVASTWDGTGVPDDTRTAGTTRVFTETILKAVMQSMYSEGASEQIDVILSAAQMDVAAGFSGIATQTQNLDKAETAAIIGAVDIYKSNFGTLRIQPSRHVADTDAYFLDREQLGIQHLRPFMVKKLPETADGHQRALLSELTLLVKNEKGLGRAADLKLA